VTAKEMRLAAYFLDWFGEVRGNAGCNDMPQEALDAAGFTDAESRLFARECCDRCYGMTIEEIDASTFERTSDMVAIHQLALKLRVEANQREKP
jgi:hypothetical protein